MGKYKSRFTDKQVTAAQYIVEVILERLYKSENKGCDPCYQFWKEERWSKEFAKQSTLMGRLAKLGVTPPAISRALKTQKGRTCFSLGAPWLKQLALNEQKKINLEIERASKTPPPTVDNEVLPLNRPAQNSDKKSKLQLLEEENNGEESTG